jgi:sterol desaturase/sphingolipid hydroxylase (fatty acid hydroxylase superfamily)
MNADLSTGTLIVSIVAMLGYLFLATRSMQSHQLGREKTLKFAAIWIAIFAFVAFVATRFGG